MQNIQTGFSSTSNTGSQQKIKRPKRISSKDIFGGNIEVIIEHAGLEYRLRITRQNKLILTK
jgi:hemin uptake protein HemP